MSDTFNPAPLSAPSLGVGRTPLASHITEVSLPWATSNVSSDFFHYLSIDPSRWDQLYPYQLLVIDATNNDIVQGSKGTLLPPNIQVTQGTGSAIVSFEPQDKSWIFQLPISPQQLNITDQFAIQTTATLRGIMEEHSGVRFKRIVASGSLGVWPQRSSVTTPPGSPSVLQSLFAGTIEAAGSVVTSINNAINIATGNHPASKPLSLRPETSEFGITSTGYYQSMQLQQFLEQYAEAKKDPRNASWRLVFNIPKQNQSFIVTPVTYTWQQNATRPMEFGFHLEFKAWRRVFLKQTPQQLPANNQPLSPGILQRILGTIAAARQTISSVTNLLQAVYSDLSQPLNAIRQTALFVKTLAGVVTTATDLKNALVAEYTYPLSTYMVANRSSIASSTTDPKTIKALNAIVGLSQQNEGLPLSAVASGQLGTSATSNLATSPALAPFSNPTSYYVLLDQVPLSSLTLTNAQQQTVNALVTAASNTTVAQLKQYRQQVQNLAVALSNSFGTGSAFYNKLFNLPPPATRELPITLSEYEILSTLYEVMASIDILTATTQVDTNNTQSVISYVAGLASVAGVEFVVPTAKMLAPVPFGLSIEQIAARYLGDANRWLEIATLNNLVEPYIDNTGFQYPLLSNAVGRQIVIGNNVDLFVGQTVFLNSNTQSTVARNIISIDTLVSSGSYLVTLDGLANLGNFLVSDDAYVQAYLPGTVNYQQKIYIPVAEPPPNVGNVIPPAVTTGDPYTAISQVDWLLQENGDIALSGTGDFLFSYGLTNIIQALRIKFMTQMGTVLLHPDFGLGISPGTSIADVNLQDLYNSISTMVTQDSRFSGIASLQITQNGPALAINVGVTIPGVTGVFPVSFELNPNQNQ